MSLFAARIGHDLAAGRHQGPLGSLGEVVTGDVSTESAGAAQSAQGLTLRGWPAADAMQTLLALGDDRACGQYPRLISRGALVATVALDLDLRPTPVRIRARRTPDGDVALTGITGPVLDVAAAGLVICLTTDGADATAGTAVSAFTVGPLTLGVAGERLQTLDLHRGCGRVRLEGARATALAGNAVAATAQPATRASVAVAAEQYRIMHCTLQVTTDYVAMSEHGQPVAPFHAVKHGLADLFIRCELAELLVRYAVWAFRPTTRVGGRVRGQPGHVVLQRGVHRGRRRHDPLPRQNVDTSSTVTTAGPTRMQSGSAAPAGTTSRSAGS